MEKFVTIFLLVLMYKSATSFVRPCTIFEFACGDGSCLSEELVCDGKSDCNNRTDEAEEICWKLRCPLYSFRCSYGACIDPTKVCDGYKDCLDGSDELISKCIDKSVIPRCSLDEFQCRSGECLTREKVCNGRVDCQDSSDEEEAVCLKSFCPKYGFRCRYGGCIPNTSRCDGEIDCVDGTDEDELLCGAFIDTQITKANTTGNILPGACKLSSRNDIRYINNIFQEEYAPGSFVNNGEFIEVVCSSRGLAMNVSSDFDYSNTCNSSRWTRKWSVFPACQTICSGADVLGTTIKSECEFNGEIVPCNKQHTVGTIARIQCGSFYDLPKNASHLSKTLTCQSSGSWDKMALRCEPRCGRVTQTATAYVVNGQKAKNIAEIPWAAAIYKRDTLICGGSIITERLVISAAHCFFREQPSLSESVALEDLSMFTVAVGKYLRNITAPEDFKPQFFNITEIISVPGYDGYMGFFSADFAVVVLNSFIIFRQHILPICVEKLKILEEDTTVTDGLIGTVAGWGYTTAGGEPSAFLKIAKLPTVNYNKCKREAPQNFKQFVTPDKFCAGNLGGGDAVCQGDSGSGLAFIKIVDDEEVFYLRGIVSNARQIEGECDLSFYTMFTNIDHYLRFVNSALKRYPSS